MTLDELRQEIDHLDAQIVDLLKKRVECVHEVGRIKKETGSPIFVPERESALLAKILKLNDGALPEKGLVSVYRQIMSCSFHLEGGMRIGYLGPEGTWSHQAALARFGECVELVPYASFPLVFEAVERGQVDYGVIPIENSTDGSISQAMDLLGGANCSLRICAQVHQSIQNCLLANISREDIRTIYSHPQVLGQCRDWLRLNFPHAELVATSSTTTAAKLAVDEADKGAAALGGAQIAALYGLDVLEANVQDKADNTTRFAVIGRQSTHPSGHDRTTICFGVPHTPGSLVDVLSIFKNHGVNIQCIASRPSRHAAWEYLFYIDVDGHADEAPLLNALSELHDRTPMLKVLGSYPEQ